MKTTMLITLIFGCLMFAGSSFADSGVKEVLETKEEIKTSKKRTRRKKVQMCHECGKPETKCECEGEEHGVKNDHGHGDDEGDKESENKKK
jgi:hypothetical protein